MVVFIIIIAIAIFLWWSLVPAKKDVPQNPYEKLVIYIAQLMQNTVEYNLEKAPPYVEGYYVLAALEECKNYLKQEKVEYLSLKYGIPEHKVIEIIDRCYKYAIKNNFKP